MAGLPRMEELLAIFGGDAAGLAFLIDRGVLEEPLICNNCGEIDRMKKVKSTLFRCGICRKKQSMLSGTFFGGSKLKCHKILQVVYLFLAGATHQVIGATVGTGKEAVCNWVCHIKPVIVLDLASLQDEGKRKYNRGHQVEGVWVIGGVERTAERKMFAVSVNDRSAETIRDLIEAKVHPGSIIHTDCCRRPGYGASYCEPLRDLCCP